MHSKLSQALDVECRVLLRGRSRAVPSSIDAARHRFFRTRGRSRSRRTIAGALVTLLFGLGTASCSEDHDLASDRARIDPVGSSTTAGKPDEERVGSFEWPESTDHPKIGIEVELPGRRGTIEVELLPELAPASVDRVLALSRTGHYDGTTFHRVIPGFMIQGGDPNSRDQDPTNDGRGGDPAPIPDEFSAVPFERGIVALANRGQAGSTSTQLFIMHAANRGLDGKYNVIGRVVTGLELVDAIAGVETDSVGRWGPKDRPVQSVYIRRVVELPDLSSADSGGGPSSPGQEP